MQITEYIVLTGRSESVVQAGKSCGEAEGRLVGASMEVQGEVISAARVDDRHRMATGCWPECLVLVDNMFLSSASVLKPPAFPWHIA